MSMAANHTLEDINFDEQDILKLLSRLRADKAAGTQLRELTTYHLHGVRNSW